jgi:hypothetical protein
LTQYAKNLLMVIGFGPLLVIFAASSFGFGFVNPLSDTAPHIGFVGIPGVEVGIVVFVRVGGIFVAEGIFVAVGGLGVKVVVGESVGEGRTRSVFVGANVMVGIGVRV